MSARSSTPPAAKGKPVDSATGRPGAQTRQQERRPPDQKAADYFRSK
jgi:hypothetical protein